jgi:hypothetical protein
MAKGPFWGLLRESYHPFFKKGNKADAWFPFYRVAKPGLGDIPKC